MGVREKIYKAWRGSSPRPPSINQRELDSQPPPVEPLRQPSTVQAEPKDVQPPPRHLELQGCWQEAYEKLQKENGDLVHTYEAFLLQQSRTEDTVRAESHPLPLLQSLVKDRLQEIEDSRFKITVAGKEFVVREQAQRAVHAIRSVKEFISTAVSVEPHAALAWAGALLLLHPVAKAVVQDEDAMSAFEEISNMLVRYRLVEHTHIEIYSRSSSGVPQTPPEELGASIRAQTVNLYAEILGFQIRLAQHFCKSGFYRFVDDLGVSDDWKDLLQTITGIDRHIAQDLDALGRHTLKDIHREVDELGRRLGESLDVMAQVRDETRETKQIHLLDRLPVSTGAAFNSNEDEKKSRCLEDTQVSTLSRIQEWCQSPTGESIQIYWLKGMAGTGKSTISRTVAAACHSRQPLVKGTSPPEYLCLGASFFFEQGRKDRDNASKLFTTICKQLATALPDTKNAICQALSDYPDIGNQSMSDQWNHLILQPLLSLQRQALLPLTLVIVIDALDECEKTDVQRILARFVQSQSQPQCLSTIRLRIFITSRPEMHIFSAFRGIRDRCEVHEQDLHKIPFMSDANKEDDITRFLRLGMAEARKINNLPEDWPGITTTTKLALKAGGLWIFAATTCRFFQEPGLTLPRANLRLELILDETRAGGPPQHNLYAMYRRILEFSVIDGATEEEIELICGSFKKIIGSIVVLFDTLSKTALGHLLSLDESELDDTFNGLHSVLSINEDQKGTVELLHLSFRDFLLDQQRCSDTRFWICEKTAHYTALKACLDTLSDQLQENFYGLPHPSAGPADVDRFQAPVHLQYAGLFWVNHFQLSASDPGDNGEVHKFLKVHFLHWIEFMSASHRMHEAVSALMSLTKYISSLPDTGRTELRDFVQDARRFILMFRTVIQTAPLQIYRSALVYCPEISVIRKQFQEKIPKSYGNLPAVERDWSPLLQTFEGKGEDLALSPNGKLIASQSLRIWDVTTGTLLKTLDPSAGGGAVAFSSNGESLLSLSYQGDLRVWDLATDELRQEVKSLLEDSDCCHVFSHDRSMAACASETEIQLIDVVNGKAIEPFDNHSRINSLTFSSDGQLLASVSDDHIVRIWDTRTHLRKEFCDNEADDDAFCHRVAFTNDTKVIATLSDFSTIRIWDVAKGTVIHKLRVASSHDIVFFPDNKTLLSSGEKVHVWDSASGKLLRTMSARCSGLRLSPDGKLLTTMAALTRSSGPLAGGPIRVWDTATGTLLKEVGNCESWFKALFSPDNNILAIGSRGAIRLWDLTARSTPESEKAGDNTLSLDRFTLSPSHTMGASIRGDMISLWDLKTGVFHDVTENTFIVCGDWGVPDRSDLSVKIVPGHHGLTSFHRRMLFSPDGNLLLTYHLGGGELWDTTTRGCIWSNHDIGDGTWAFSRDGSLLAYGFQEASPGSDSGSSSEPPLIIILDVQTHAPLYTMTGPDQKVEGLAFSPDSKGLAWIWTETGALEIWDVTNGLRCTSHSTLADLQCPIVWSPDGKMVSCGSGTGKILFFCADSGRFLWSLGGSRESEIMELLALAFSPDGELLASAEKKLSSSPRWTSTISLWEINSQRLVGTRTAVDDIYHSLRFSDDGKTIHSNFGRMDVRAFYPELICHEDLFLSENWIRYGENEAILLPHDHRARGATATGSTLIIEHKTGEVTLFSFEGRN